MAYLPLCQVLTGFASEAPTFGLRNFSYKDLVFEETLRFDILVNECLLLEGKCVEKILPIHKAQLMTYMRLLDIPVGLIFNYNTNTIKEDMHRLILPGANIS